MDSVLFTRPYSLSLSSVERFNKFIQYMLKPEILPLITIVEKNINIVDKGYECIIITSKNACHIIKHNPWMSKKKLFVVGKSCFFHAKNSGFNADQAVIAENSIKLKDRIKNSQEKKFLYLSGDYVTYDFQMLNNELDILVSRNIVYNGIGIEHLSREGLSLLSNIKIVLFYSARTAKIFSNICNTYNIDTKDKYAVCISKACADYLLNKKWGAIKIADFPDENNIFEKVMDLVAL